MVWVGRKAEVGEALSACSVEEAVVPSAPGSRPSFDQSAVLDLPWSP